MGLFRLLARTTIGLLFVGHDSRRTGGGSDAEETISQSSRGGAAGCAITRAATT